MSAGLFNHASRKRRSDLACNVNAAIFMPEADSVNRQFDRKSAFDRVDCQWVLVNLMLFGFAVPFWIFHNSILPNLELLP